MSTALTQLKNIGKATVRLLLPKAAFLLSLRNHFWDEIELDVLDLIVSPTRSAIDVGANSGKYSFALSKLSAHVYAIEPNPHMARILRAGLDPERATVLHRAASDSTGKAELLIPTDVWGFGGENLASLERSFSGPTKSVVVDKMTLDDLADKDIGFIKIDIEGHELAALRGATRMIRKSQPVIMLECDELGQNKIPPSFEFLRSRGYSGYFIYSNKFYALADLRPYMSDTSAFKPTKPRKLVRYTNNFLFFPSGAMTNLKLKAIDQRLSEIEAKNQTIR